MPSRLTAARMAWEGCYSHVSRRILIVEDSFDIRAALTIALEDDGYLVRALGDGANAASAVQEFRPDLVLLDMTLPDTPGVEVCKQIRAVTTVPVLIFTASSERELVTSAMQAGANGYVLKDSGAQHLVNAIRVVADGEALLSPRATSGLVSRLIHHVSPPTTDVPELALVGIEGNGFRQILDGMNAERILIAAECIGDGRFFLERAAPVPCHADVAAVHLEEGMHRPAGRGETLHVVEPRRLLQLPLETVSTWPGAELKLRILRRTSGGRWHRPDPYRVGRRADRRGRRLGSGSVPGCRGGAGRRAAAFGHSRGHSAPGPARRPARRPPASR